LFVMGFALIAGTLSISILIVDINPGRAGTATAAFNLIRCLLGAGATALILPMTDAMGLGWSFTFIGLVYIAFMPMLLVVIKWGPAWRRKRWAGEKEEKARKEKEREDGEKV